MINKLIVIKNHNIDNDDRQSFTREASRNKSVDLSEYTPTYRREF